MPLDNSIMVESLSVRPEFLSFNWRSSAAEYVLHKKMMPDYLRTYIHALGSFRGETEEPLEDLKSRLRALSESPLLSNSPNISLMPPNISGMVRNLASNENFDLELLLSERNDLFLLKGSDTVAYLHMLPKEEARQKLNLILVEGLFLYFLAKFLHQEEFPIKLTYYNRSEPLKTSLFFATGCKNIKDALETYFSIYPDVFCIDPDVSTLRLRRSYFDPRYRRALRKYVESHEVTRDKKLNPKDSDVTTLGVVLSKIESNACFIQFIHFPNVPPALLQLPEGSSLPTEGNKIWFKARNAGNPLEPSWRVESFSYAREEVISVEASSFNTLEDISGNIRAVLSPRSAIICFMHQGKEEEAYLHVNHSCFNGLGMGLGIPLELYIEKDDPVIFDTCRQNDYRGICYRVCRISLDVAQKSKKAELEAFNKIEWLLGGYPRLPDHMESLIHSVLKWGTSDVVLPRLLIEPNALESILKHFNKFDRDAKQEEDLILTFEKLARKLLAKLIVDHKMTRATPLY